MRDIGINKKIILKRILEIHGYKIGKYTELLVLATPKDMLEN